MRKPYRLVALSNHLPACEDLESVSAGRRYALAAGAEPELYQRIIDEIVRWRGEIRKV